MKLSYCKHTVQLLHNIEISVNKITLIHCQCHFGKVKSSQCLIVDTGAAATLRYAIFGTGSDGDHNAMTQTCLLHHDFICGNPQS